MSSRHTTIPASGSLDRPASSRTERVRWGAAALLALAAFPLGMFVAAVGAWYAMKSGSMLYLPISLLALLACVAVVQRHGATDLVASAMVAVVLIAWFQIGAASRGQLVERVFEVSGQLSVLSGLLLSLCLLLVLRLVSRKRIVRAARNEALAG